MRRIEGHNREYTPTVYNNFFNNGSQVIYNHEPPFYKNKYAWITAGVLLLTSIYVGYNYFAASAGAYQNNILGSVVFGSFYFTLTAVIGALFSFSKKWYNFSTNIWKAYTPFLLLLIINIAMFILFFWAGIILAFFMTGMFRLLIPYSLGYLLSNWVFQDFNSEEFMSKLRARRANRVSSYGESPSFYQETPTVQFKQYTPTNYPKSKDPTFGAPRIKGNNSKQITDDYNDINPDYDTRYFL